MLFINYKIKDLYISKGSFKYIHEREEVIGDIGPMGSLRGVVKQASVYPDAPHSARSIYMFRYRKIGLCNLIIII